MCNHKRLWPDDPLVILAYALFIESILY